MMKVEVVSETRADQIAEQEGFMPIQKAVNNCWGATKTETTHDALIELSRRLHELIRLVEALPIRGFYRGHLIVSTDDIWTPIPDSPNADRKFPSVTKQSPIFGDQTE